MLKYSLLVRKKTIEILKAQLDDDDKEGLNLKRSLGVVHLTALGIGGIIGAGLFSLTGLVAANNAGPAVTISFIIAGLGCIFAALCYAEFASMLPVAGSAYTYSYVSFGEFTAWMVGWNLMLEYAVAAATVAISWSRYFEKVLELFGVHLPVEYMMSPFETTTLADGTVHHGLINVPAVGIIVLLSALLIRGTKESALVNNLIVLVKMAVVFLFIVLGWQYIKPENYHPFIPQNTGTFGEYGWSGIFRGAAVIFFAYTGFDAVSTAAQEAKDPQRTVPKGILLSLGICTVLYLLFSHVMTGLANYVEFKGHDGIAPVAVAISHTPYVFLQEGIIIAILAGYSSVIMVMLYGQVRVFYSMARDGLLPKVFSEVHPKWRTTYKSNTLICIFVSVFAAICPPDVVAELTSIGTLFAFLVVCLGITFLRYKIPQEPRFFRVPFGPWVIPVLGAIFSFGLMISLPLDTWIRFVIWVVLGIIIYYGYGVKNSVMNKYDK